MCLRTLLHPQKAYLPCSQCFPHSLRKTPGVGYPAFQKGASAARLIGLATAMNSQAVSTVLSTRCSHRTATDRQCRQLAADPQSGLCSHHRAVQKQMEADDLSDNLLARSQNFQTAQGVNFALANIYRLLAANRISPRRASVLAYINSLLLRTLPAIDYDQENGHTDPTAPESQEGPDPHEAPSLERTAESEPDVEAKSDPPKTNTEHSAPSPSGASTTNDSAPSSKYRSYWDAIPDPTKKPS